MIAAARQSSPELDGLGVRVERLDMGNHEALARFSPGVDRLDLLIANAGTGGPRDAGGADEAREWLDTFAVNTVAPYLLANAAPPQVRAAGGKLIAVSTRMGSIADNTGGFLAYRSSKTALNMAWRTLALAERDLTGLVLHPGWVQTRMGGANAPVTPQESIGGMRRVIERFSPKHFGEFFDYQGQRVPW